MKRRTTLLLAAILVLFGAFSAWGETPEEMVHRAQNLFQQYTSLEDAFNPAVANLYADTALIRSTRRHPDGEAQTLHIPAQRYKSMIRQLMPLAKTRNDRGEYSNITYHAEEDRVRIKATRYSVNKKYSAPVELVVGPTTDGHWLIFEEYSETQP